MKLYLNFTPEEKKETLHQMGYEIITFTALQCGDLYPTDECYDIEVSIAVKPGTEYLKWVGEETFHFMPWHGVDVMFEKHITQAYKDVLMNQMIKEKIYE